MTAMARVLVLVLPIAAAFACGRSLGEEGEPAPDVVDAAIDRDAPPAEASTPFDGGDPDPVDVGGDPPPPIGDAGCADAAFAESFDTDFASRWSTQVTDGGMLELGAPYVVGPSALHARIDTTASGVAFAKRAVCPSMGAIACAFSLRIDQSTDGDIGILDLRGKGANGYGVARVKAREIMFLSPGDGGQRVDRAPVSLATSTAGAFHTVEVLVTATTFSLRLDGVVSATLPVPAAGLSIDQVHAGIVYAAGTRAPGWDVRIDELRCHFE